MSQRCDLEIARVTFNMMQFVPNDMVVDDSGNVYITGRSWKNAKTNYATVKYNSEGIEQWSATYQDSLNIFGYNRANSIAVDDSGNVYITGDIYRTNTGYDILTIKYNKNGVTQWVVPYDNQNKSEHANHIEIDDSGYVYVAGYINNSITAVDYMIIKYNSNGEETWVSMYNGPGDLDDLIVDIALDNNGNIYATGTSQGLGTYNDFATLKYNSEGIEQWVARYDGARSKNDAALGIVVDDTGNVYITGRTWGYGSNVDIATVKYDSSGTEKWVINYNAPENFDDYVAAIAVDNFNNVYVTGFSYIDYYQPVYTTIKYVQDSLVFIEDNSLSNPNHFSLFQNYPNPFNPVTKIRYTLMKTGFVSLKIYDITGKEVAKLINEKRPIGSYEIEFDAEKYDLSSGIYFYRIQAGEYKQVKRMLLLK